MTVEELLEEDKDPLKYLLEKYKKKYPGVLYEIYKSKNKYKEGIVSLKDGERHSYNDAPAYITARFTTENWYKEGKLHRENDKPAVVNNEGDKSWYYEGKLHRENDKPAYVTWNGFKAYWYHGKRYYLEDDAEKKIEKLTTKKSSKQKEREDLLKEFVSEVLST